MTTSKLTTKQECAFELLTELERATYDALLVYEDAMRNASADDAAMSIARLRHFAGKIRRVDASADSVVSRKRAEETLARIEEACKHMSALLAESYAKSSK